MMHPLPFPQPPPEVPKKPFFLGLGLPPAVPLFNLFLELVTGGGIVGALWLNLLALTIGMGFFFHAVSRRYRGVSRSFLLWSYMLGQIIGCIALWIAFSRLIYWFQR